MEKQNHKFAPDPTNDDLDRALDGALARYSAAEPRPGLEDRVLASLRAEQLRPAERPWWKWGLAAAVAAIFIAVIALALRLGNTHRPTTAAHPGAAAPTSPIPGTQLASRPANPVHLANASAHKKPVRSSKTQSLVAKTPKLDSFPSPQPLSEQERFLENYVQQRPAEAVFVAEARAKLLRKDLEEEMTQPPAPVDDAHQESDTTNR